MRIRLPQEFCDDDTRAEAGRPNSMMDGSLRGHGVDNLSLQGVDHDALPSIGRQARQNPWKSNCRSDTRCAPGQESRELPEGKKPQSAPEASVSGYMGKIEDGLRHDGLEDPSGVQGIFAYPCRRARPREKYNYNSDRAPRRCETPIHGRIECVHKMDVVTALGRDHTMFVSSYTKNLWS